MALATTRQQTAVDNMALPVGVEVVAEERGAYRGETVRSIGETSKIAQAGGRMGVTHPARRRRDRPRTRPPRLPCERRLPD